MTTRLSAAALLISQTADDILAASLKIAALVGLPVTSWRVGDPTRTQLRTQARKLETLDAVRVQYAQSSFLLTATGDMLTLRASDVYNVDRDEDTFATPTLTVDNTGGGFFEIEERALVVSSSVTGATYVNQDAITIDSLETGVEILLIAEKGGSAGSVGADEIDGIVSPHLEGVEIVGNTAASGVDAQSDPGVVEDCLSSLGALSPNGPVDAYEFVARNSELTGVIGVTRALALGDNATGTIAVYVGTATAALGSEAIEDIQAACDSWSQPLCSDATVIAMTPRTENLTITITPAAPDAQDQIEADLDAYFAAWDHTATGGLVARDAVAAIVRAAVLAVVGVPPFTVTVAGSDTTYAENEFPVRGTVTLP